jgi:predicted PurR-regulated permease PerM
MNSSGRYDAELERRMKAALLDVLIRAGLIAAMAVLCYQVYSPFLQLTVWAIILAVALYPLHQAIAGRLGGRQGLSSISIVVLGAALILAPTAVLMGRLGDSVHQLILSVQANTLQVPPPPPGVAAWPIVGAKIHALWSEASTDLPALIQSQQPEIGDIARAALAFVAGIGGAFLKLVAAFVIAVIIMAYGEAATRSSRAIFERMGGTARAGDFTGLATATIRAVALGVIGVAVIQSILVGLMLLIAHVPLAGVAAAVVLVLAIAQVPALVVTLPAIAYIWMSSHYGTGAAIAYTIGLVLAGMADNVIKPLLLGRGVDAPMPVILLGALGGMAAAGILGMFVGATLLALGYQIFMRWVAERHESDPDEAAHASDPETQSST